MCLGVILPQYPPTLSQYVLIEVSRRLVFTEPIEVPGKIVGKGEGPRGDPTPHSARSGKDILIQLSRRLVLPQLPQTVSQATGGDERIRVILTQHPATPRQRILIELAGLRVAAHGAQGFSKGIRGPQGGFVVGA